MHGSGLFVRAVLLLRPLGFSIRQSLVDIPASKLSKACTRNAGFPSGSQVSCVPLNSVFFMSDMVRSTLRKGPNQRFCQRPPHLSFFRFD